MLNVSGFARVRPIRVAFLVPEDEYAHTILDAVFANCHARWGGRYSLIVPCEGMQPRAAYLAWLDLFDADIVYSYVDMDEAAISRFHERFGPSYLVRHTPYDQGPRDKRYFRPELPISCLTSLSVAPQYARAHPVSAPQPMLIVDRLMGEPENRFVDDNFGSISDAFGFWPLPGNLSDTIRPLYLASDELQTNWRSGQMPPGERVADVPTLLAMMAQKHNAFGLAQLAADSAPRFEPRDLWDSNFLLFVGDSFAERIAFWNNRSRFPVYLGRSFTSLIVSPELLKDEKFFTALVEFLRFRNGLRPSNGTPGVELTSTSVPVADLEAYAVRLRRANTWNLVHVNSQSLLKDVPSAQVLGNAKHSLVSGGSFNMSPDWREFPADGAVIMPPALIPKMLDGVSASLVLGGSWAVDVCLQRQKNLTRFANIKHEWRLPRRLRLHGAFVKPYVNSSSSRYQFPRVTADGLLTFYSRINESPPSITAPDDRTALTHSMLQRQDWPPFGEKNSEYPSGPYKYAQISDKGRYLLGTLGLFGGLQEAGKVLLHRFWKESFDMFGAAKGDVRNQEIVNVLRKKLKTKKLETESDWGRLASIVAAEARRVRMPLRSIGFDRLEERLKSHVDKERHALNGLMTADADDLLAVATALLARSVQKLCGRKVLHQGYEWRCQECFHDNWSDVRSLRPMLICEVCQRETLLPVNRQWDFRLNDFLLESLKEHGVLALVWCLLQLEGRSRRSFYFLEPTELFSAYPQGRVNQPTNEADLVCVVDNEAYLCEVKSSSRDIDCSSFVEVARKVRPDVALLAVMDSMSQVLLGKAEELRRELEPEGVRVELMTFDERHLEGGVCWLGGD